jgi:hypothetical protein
MFREGDDERRAGRQQRRHESFLHDVRPQVREVGSREALEGICMSRRRTRGGRDVSARQTVDGARLPPTLSERAARLRRIACAVLIEIQFAAFLALFALVIARIAGITPS